MNKEEMTVTNCEETPCEKTEKTFAFSSYAFSAAIGALLCVLFVILEEFIFDRSATPIWIIYFGIMFSQSILDAIRKKAKIDILLSVLWGLALASDIAAYIVTNI